VRTIAADVGIIRVQLTGTIGKPVGVVILFRPVLAENYLPLLRMAVSRDRDDAWLRHEWWQQPVIIALTTEVVADVLVELLTEQPVLDLQRDDTRTQLIYSLEQRGVGIHQLAYADSRRRKKFHNRERFFRNILTPIPVLF
jgi:hypothetical protein